MNVIINVVELASELASLELHHVFQSLGRENEHLVEEKNGDTRYTEEAQDLFNDLYEKYWDIIKGTVVSNPVESCKEILSNAGYSVNNLWCVDDVKGKFDCTDDEAMRVMDRALSNDATMEQIWLAIEMTGDADGLTKIEGD